MRIHWNHTDIYGTNNYGLRMIMLSNGVFNLNIQVVFVNFPFKKALLQFENLKNKQLSFI